MTNLCNAGRKSIVAMENWMGASSSALRPTHRNALICDLKAPLAVRGGGQFCAGGQRASAALSSRLDSGSASLGARVLIRSRNLSLMPLPKPDATKPPQGAGGCA